MILLYLLSLVAILVLFVPSNIIPAIIKWPSSFIIVFLIVFIFNLCKRDTIYLVKDSKKKIVNRGLFNPLLVYVSAVLYIFGFILISAQLDFYHVTDYISQFNDIIEVFSASTVNNVLMGLILVFVSILIYYLRYLFKANANDSTLRGRAFLYTGFSIILILIGFINIYSFSDFLLCEYLKTNLNWVVFLGLIGLVLLIDFIGLLIRIRRRKKRLINSLVKELRPDKVVEVKVAEPVVTPSKKERMAMKKQAKIDKIVAKKVAKIDAKEAKNASKNPQKTAVVESEKPLTRKERKLVKKQAKKDKKLAKKQAKKDNKQAKKDKKIAKKQAKNAKKYAKKEAKIDKKVKKIKDKIEKRVNE